ncbi:MAG: SRPBCC family protein [Planctomycetota bacterium]
MKVPNVDSPEITDAVCKQKTGKTLKQWFEGFDKAGGLERGRRELTNSVHEQVNKDAWWATTLAVEYERARGQVEKDGKPTGYSMCSTKTIAAPLDRVFAAFGEPKQLDNWFGPKNKVSFKDGGGFENGDGDKGTFKRIRALKDIRFSWEHPTLGPGTAVEVLFADKGKGKTGITLNHTRIQSRREADQIRESWSAAFESLKRFIESA